VIFEVPAQYIKQKVNVRYNPADLSAAYIFNEHNKLAHTIYPLRRVDNSKIKRQQALDYNLAARHAAGSPGLSVEGGGRVG
jgi:hypothetical protein